jgi:hypothetical protein
MRHLNRRLAVPAVVVGLIVPLASAQDQASGGAWETQVIPVSHVDARTLAQSLMQLEFPVRASAPDSSRLILQGTSSDIKRALNLVGELDTPTVPATAAEESIAYIPLGQVPTDDLMSLVNAVAPGGFDTAYALDEVNKLLVVRAAQPTINRVRELVKAVDRPAKSMTIEFFFIRGSIATGGGMESQVPPVLKPVADTLRANGMGGMSLLAPIIVNVHEGHDFQTESALALEDETRLNFYIEGTAHSPAGGESVQLEAKAHVTNIDSKDRVFTTQTTVAANLGAYTILAAAPGSAGGTNAIALAIRVTNSD